jgi:hypothetical protein
MRRVDRRGNTTNSRASTSRKCKLPDGGYYYHDLDNFEVLFGFLMIKSLVCIFII